MRKNISKLLLFVLFSCFIFSCKIKPVEKKAVEDKITIKTKDSTKEIYNQDKTLILILSHKFDGNIPTTFNYKVIDAKTKETKKEGVFTGSNIQWQDNKSLKCIKHIGMVQKGNENPLIEKNKKSTNYIIIEINN
jgi:hypothetical protein